MKRSLLACVTFLTLASSPAFALTIGEAQSELGGMSCSGSSCSSSFSGTRTEPTSVTRSVETPYSDTSAQPQGVCPGMIGSYNQDCVAVSIMGPTGGGSVITEVTEAGPDRTIDTLTTTVKTLSYDPALGFQNGWSIDTTVTTRDK